MMTNVEFRRWATPAFGVVIGIAFAVIFLAHDDVFSAIGSLVLMVGYSTLLVLGRRNELVGLLGAGEPDERREEISRRAALFAGYVLLAFVGAAFIWELAHGRDGQPYTYLCAIAGAAFIGGTVWYRRAL